MARLLGRWPHRRQADPESCNYSEEQGPGTGSQRQPLPATALPATALSAQVPPSGCSTSRFPESHCKGRSGSPQQWQQTRGERAGESGWACERLWNPTTRVVLCSASPIGFVKTVQMGPVYPTTSGGPFMSQDMAAPRSRETEGPWRPLGARGQRSDGLTRRP